MTHQRPRQAIDLQRSQELTDSLDSLDDRAHFLNIRRLSIRLAKTGYPPAQPIKRQQVKPHLHRKQPEGGV
jgi:hypothetical protein